MNWLAWDSRAYGGAALGGALGFALFAVLIDAGSFSPWVIGLGMGLGCAALTLERNGLRGIVIAVAAGWVGAIAQCAYLPGAPGENLLQGLLSFHETLTPGRLLLHVVGMAAAFLLGRTSLRAGAQKRVAGTGRPGAAGGSIS